MFNYEIKLFSKKNVAKIYKKKFNLKILYLNWSLSCFHFTTTQFIIFRKKSPSHNYFNLKFRAIFYDQTFGWLRYRGWRSPYKMNINNFTAEKNAIFHSVFTTLIALPQSVRRKRYKERPMSQAVISLTHSLPKHKL